MNRRKFIAGVGGAAIASQRGAFAQTRAMARLGVLTSSLAESDAEGRARVDALRQGLRELGWIEGQNIEIAYRWSAGDRDRARANAADLVALKPDVIFAAPTSSLAALKPETQTVPIVFAQVTDPVGAGFVASLARPGGNITGFTQFEFAVGAKWPELLKQVAPSIVRARVVYDLGNPTSAGYLPVIKQAAALLGIEVRSYLVRDTDEIARAIAGFAAEPHGGLIPLPSPLVGAHRDLIISLAMRHRLPNVYSFRYYPASGGLASYGVDNLDLYKRAASYIDRILKGAKPADLPVQQASKYELVINLKAAKALGLEVPPMLLATANEVIE
jgi:putative tryptophan/tyrosine transport system substrate-binding protein